MAIPGIISLVIFIYARPQEFFERLRVVPFLHVFCALAVFGAWLDVGLGNTRLRSTPQLPWVIALFWWSALTVLVAAPAAAMNAVMELSICVALYLLIGHGVQTFRGVHAVAAVVLAMVVFVCGVGAHQGFSPTGCVVVDESKADGASQGTADGRPCETPRDCYLGTPEPGAEYLCERIGLLGTTSIGEGRVRYRGVLQDPNELSLAGAIGLPLAFAFGQVRRRSNTRHVVTALTLALVVVCAVMTGSRGGQLVFLTVLGAYFFRRFGLRGLALGGVLALPLLLLGGRSGEEAESSTLERLDCWREALSLSRAHPFLGVGLRQFGEHNYQTAHNSYLLALAELGVPGMLLFSVVVYLSAKIPIAVLAGISSERTAEPSAGAAIARPWAMALIAALAGLGVGIFFLSFTYHYILWIYFGLAGALYSAVRTHDPTFRVRFSPVELALVATADAAIVGLVFLYTRWMH